MHRHPSLTALAATCLLCSFTPTASAADERVANFETGEPGTQAHEDFSFWVHADGRREIVYGYGKDGKEVVLKPLGVDDAGGKPRLKLGFPNGLVLDLVVDGSDLVVRDDAGTYSKTFRWEYEGPIEGRGTFCTPCVEEDAATAFLKTHFVHR